MYELISIDEYTATRFVQLKNLGTGVIEECFDDSAIVSEVNFEFMMIGQQYECKIMLFGKPVPVKVNGSVTCKVVNKEVVVGRRTMVEIQANGGMYYVEKRDVTNYLNQDEFEFYFTRKDLIQVEDVIHADLL